MIIGKKTVSLIRSIGIPNIAPPISPASVEDALRLFDFARLNKVSLLYLESIEKNMGCIHIIDLLSEHRERYKKTLDAITALSHIFDEAGVHYTLFKTLKPFPFTPADIDILLPTNNDFVIANKTLKALGFKPLNRDAYSSSFFDIDHHINIDLALEITVSNFIYLDKELLLNHICQTEINGYNVRTLNPQADLLTTTMHSLYKEQMFTLSDYYTFTSYADHLREAYLLAQEAYAEKAFSATVNLMRIITFSAFGLEDIFKVTSKVLKIQGYMSKSFVELPAKYTPYTLLESFTEKILKDPSTRRSLPAVFKSTFSISFIKKLWEHVKRVTY